MKEREIRIARLKMVLREHDAALVAISILDRSLKPDPSLMARHDLLQQDFRSFRDNLEATYFIRLFAEFESCLRHYWRSLSRRSVPGTTALINAIASRVRIGAEVLDETHDVRRYRNVLVHEDAKKEWPAITVAEALGLLHRFAKYLPADW